MDGNGASRDGLAARLTVEPTAGCPFWTVVSELRVLSSTPAPVGGPPQVVVETDRTTAAERPELEPVAETDRAVVCELPALAGRPDCCDHDRCLGRGVEWLPVAPFERHYGDGAVTLELATDDESLVRSTMSELETVGFEVRVDRVTETGAESGSRLVVVDRGELTPRQREVAELALEYDYFDQDGASADAVAEELGISKSTVSDHLRSVQGKIGGQVFPESR